MPLSQAVILAPDSVDRNLIQPTADANKGLALKGHSATQAAMLLEIQDSIGAVNGGFRDTGRLTALRAEIGGDYGNNEGFVVHCLLASGGGTFFETQNENFDTCWGCQTTGVGAANYCRSNADADAALVVIGNGGGQSAAIFQVQNGATIPLDVWPDKIGFLGASAVVRQTGCSAAAIAAITDPNVKACIQALQTALGDTRLGLLTTPA